ncbi:protein-L-isoaspartate O-methyltransferase [Filobasidium floriforme]|uniref:protein-L-isoaspartate O-methyltransferase n=1 Tax=Filobasidium floriforme TaxID=5210 RepID=UPI001E8E26B4|nr:protein-L-isoaspartate O-methyltransferase [Filobasidium floriforme]KAH8080197.1 protein-L-isoaspartate O-methyltransferase [Filobasidium floriforme]
MAWHCTGKTNAELIDNLVTSGIARPGRIAEAMKATDRRYYVPDKPTAYEDSPQPIGFGATISAPHMHAYALNSLEDYLGEGTRVLDVGCGSGYLTAVMHRLVGPTGLIIGIDHLPGLVEMSKNNLATDGVSVSSAEQQEMGAKTKTKTKSGDADGGKVSGETGVKIVLGDGREGYAPLAPYKAIHVGAASPTIPPALLAQLDSPGRMFIPVGPAGGKQVIKVVTKDAEGEVRVQDVMDVRYVPLTDARKQWSG